MARGRPGGWGRRSKTEGPPFARPPRRPPGARPDAEVLARLARLESLVLAIAEHLGIEAPPGGRHEARRAAREPAGRAERPRSFGPAPQPAGDAHAVVRTVARGLQGRLKQYNAERGYGFVVSADGPEDIFFHRSDCRADPETLQPSASVTFDVVEMANGQFKATNLDAR